MVARRGEAAPLRTRQMSGSLPLEPRLTCYAGHRVVSKRTGGSAYDHQQGQGQRGPPGDTQRGLHRALSWVGAGVLVGACLGQVRPAAEA